MNSEVEDRGNTTRRAVVKGAAWSVPVIAAAVAAPAAVASVNTLSVAVTGPVTSLLQLRLLDGSGLLTAQALTTVPTSITFTNGLGAISGQQASITVTVARPGGINIPVGRARGFGVYAYNGVPVPAGERTAVYQSAPIIGQFGFPLTTWTGTRPVTVASNGSLVVPVEFGLAGTSTGVTISALSSFPVTVNVTIGGRTISGSGTISVPVGAGLL